MTDVQAIVVCAFVVIAIGTIVAAAWFALREQRSTTGKPAYVITVCSEPDPMHDPRVKLTGQCPVSPECTDVTGRHHSYVVVTDDPEAERAWWNAQPGIHVTRVERVDDRPPVAGRELEPQEWAW